MKTRLAIHTCSHDVLLPRASATVACIDFVSCERVRFDNGVLRHTQENYTIPALGLDFFDAEVRGEEWPEA